MHIFPVDQGHGDALMAGTTGTANPVQVGLFIFGRLEVIHVGDFFDVDPAGGDIGGDQHIDLAVAEGAQCLFTSTLAKITVQGSGGESAAFQFFSNPGGTALGAGKDNCQATIAGLQGAC